MKFLSLSAIAMLSVLALSACKTTADTKNDRYSIDLDGGSYHFNGDEHFCPPGQAKKGNC